MKNNNFKTWCVKETIAKIMFITGFMLAMPFALLCRAFHSTPLFILLIIFIIIGCFGGMWLSALYDE